MAVDTIHCPALSGISDVKAVKVARARSRSRTGSSGSKTRDNKVTQDDNDKDLLLQQKPLFGPAGPYMQSDVSPHSPTDHKLLEASMVEKLSGRQSRSTEMVSDSERDRYRNIKFVAGGSEHRAIPKKDSTELSGTSGDEPLQDIDDDFDLIPSREVVAPQSRLSHIRILSRSSTDPGSLKDPGLLHSHSVNVNPAISRTGPGARTNGMAGLAKDPVQLHNSKAGSIQSSERKAQSPEGSTTHTPLSSGLSKTVQKPSTGLGDPTQASTQMIGRGLLGMMKPPRNTSQPKSIRKSVPYI